MMEMIFCLSIAFIFYTYIGYPLSLVLKCVPSMKVLDKSVIFQPTISVIIAVRDEEESILRRIENLIAQHYPQNLCQIIIVSDGSNDRTIEFLRSVENERLIVIDNPTNCGKAFCLNQGIEHADGDIIIFTDARQKFNSDVFSQLTSNFIDPKVGCVSGELLFIINESSSIQSEMGVYWKYEKWVRKLESLTGSAVGATGAIYAIRRHLFKQLPKGTLLDDVLTPMNIVMQGYRTVFDSNAIAIDVVSKNIHQEWRRKVRTLAGNWQLLNLHPALFLPWSNPCWWRFISHKILRLLVPFALVLLFVSGLLLAGGFYRMMTMAQLLFYSIALVGFFVPAARNYRIVRIIYFFIVMNMAAVGGFCRWITGRCATAWQPEAHKKGA
jgi:biofilm PGA synthesis N-glycosyltransferase PgaC